MKYVFHYPKMGRNKTKIQLLLITLCFVVVCYSLTLLFSQKEKYPSDLFMITVSRPCGDFPLHENLNISDKYWQVTNTTNGTFYLFNAYFDDRKAVNGSVVRFLGLINKIRPTIETYCQLWFSGMLKPISSKVYEYRVLWNNTWGDNHAGASPYLISCRNPLERLGLIPTHVSLVEKKCATANNFFSITNNRPKDGLTKIFLVCLKALNFKDDISLLLIEWAEILKIFGVDNVAVYVTDVHPKVMKVIEYYGKSGFFIVKFVKFPHELPNGETQSWYQWLQNDLISYNDAFYENCYKYEFFIPLDIDEFIMPLRNEDKTWLDLLLRTITRQKEDNNRIIDVYFARNMYFLLKSVHENETIDGIPKQLRFLSNIYHCSNFTPHAGNAKSFMRMDRVQTVHNHFPLSCISYEFCNRWVVDESDGLLWHYRMDCDNPECLESKPNPVKNTQLWKYKDKILKNIETTVLKLGEEFLELN